MTILMAMAEVSIEVASGVTPGADNTNSSCDIRTRRSTDTNEIDADYSRGSYMRYSSTVAGDHDFVNKVAYDSVGMLWVHFHTYDRSQLNPPYVRIKDSSGDRIFTVGVLNGISSCSMQVWNYNDSDSNVDNISQSVSDIGSSRDFDFALDIANDLVHFYQDGVHYGTQAMDLNLRASVDMDHIDLLCTSRTGATGISQLMIVADEVTIDWKIKDINPDGAGNHTDWTGAYTDVNEIAYDPATETTVVGAGTNSYTYSDVQAGIQTGYEIKMVMVSTVAAADSAATAPNVQNLVRISSTDYLQGSAVDVEDEDNRSAIVDYMFVSPDTSVAWTFAEINAAEFGYASS